MTDLYIGVDCGLGGAVGVVDAAGAFVSVWDMPVVAVGRGTVRREVDAVGLADLLRPLAADIRLAVVERVGAMPKQGLSSTFSFGRSLGIAEAVLAALQIPSVLVSATTWKKRCSVPADKREARAIARRRWPTAPLELVRHDGRAESLLLGWYGIACARPEAALPGLDPGPLAGVRAPVAITLPADERDAPAAGSSTTRK